MSVNLSAGKIDYLKERDKILTDIEEACWDRRIMLTDTGVIFLNQQGKVIHSYTFFPEHQNLHLPKKGGNG